MDENAVRFIFYFNKGRQWCEVFLHDVTPAKFYRYAKTRWGFYWGYNPAKCRKIYKGFFGELHFVASRVTLDTVAHEIDHLRWDWIRARRIIPSPRNEERLACLLDEMTRNFWREYNKVTG